MINKSKSLYLLGAHALILTCMSATAGVPMLSIASATTNINLQPSQTTQFTYTVTNNAGIPINNIKYFNPDGTTIDATSTCGSTLATNATCNVVLNYTSPPASVGTGDISLALTVCGANGLICSTASATNTVTVNSDPGNAPTGETTAYVTSGTNPAQANPFSLTDASLGTAITLTGCQQSLGGGSFSGRIAFTPNGSRGYVVCNNGGGGSEGIAVFNPANNSFVQMVTTDSDTGNVIADATNFYVIDNTNLEFYNVSDNMLSSTNAIGGGGAFEGFSRDGLRVIVVRGGSEGFGGNRLRSFLISNPATTVDGGPYVGDGINTTIDGMAIHPTRDRVYLSQVNNNALTIVNSTTLAEVSCFNNGGAGSCTANANIPGGASAHGIAISPDGNSAIMTNSTVNNYIYIDATNDTITSATNFGAGTLCTQVTVAPTTPAIAYVTCTGNVLLVDMSNGTVSGTQINKAGVNRDPVASANGGQVVFGAQGDNTANVIDTSDNSFQASGVLGTLPGDIGIVPVG